MPIARLNHAVLYVRNAAESARFYEEVLGFRPVMTLGGGHAIFLQAEGSNNDHDLGLFTMGAAAEPSDAGRRTVGLYHLAWEVDTLEELERIGLALAERQALVGASDHGSTKALYARDPDGIEFEITWLVPAALLGADVLEGRPSIRPLDLAGEKERYGATTQGGVGVSRPSVPA